MTARFMAVLLSPPAYTPPAATAADSSASLTLSHLRGGKGGNKAGRGGRPELSDKFSDPCKSRKTGRIIDSMLRFDPLIFDKAL